MWPSHPVPPEWGWRVEEAPVSKTETKDKNTNSSKGKRANDFKFRLLAHDGAKKKWPNIYDPSLPEKYFFRILKLKIVIYTPERRSTVKTTFRQARNMKIGSLVRLTVMNPPMKFEVSTLQLIPSLNKVIFKLAPIKGRPRSLSLKPVIWGCSYMYGPFCPYRSIFKVHVDTKQLYSFEESSDGVQLRIMFYKMKPWIYSLSPLTRSDRPEFSLIFDHQKWPEVTGRSSTLPMLAESLHGVDTPSNPRVRYLYDSSIK